MGDLERASALLGVEDKWLQPYDVVDPITHKRLEGHLCQRPDHNYGAMALLRVNGLSKQFPRNRMQKVYHAIWLHTEGGS